MTTRRDEERELQDYLDGRLSDEKRKRFEARLRSEPELARRVKECREIGDSLREGDEELSPGFYTRARAAFEEAAKGGEPRRWFRPLSWETAGLVAVVAVAAALFVPELVRSPMQWKAFDGPAEPQTIEVRKYVPPETAGADEAVEGEPVRRMGFAEAPEPEAVEEDADATPQDLYEGPVVAGRGAPPEPKAAVPRQTPAPESEDPGGAAKKEAPSADAVRDKGEDREAEQVWAPSPADESRVERAAAEPPVTEEKLRREESAEERYQEARAAARSLKSVGAAEGETAIPSAAVALPPGLVEPGAIRVIEQPEEWEVFLESPGERVVSDLGGHDPNSRLVLIGARPEPFDCASLSVVTTEKSHWLLLSPPVEGGRGAEHGCALLLPRDGRTIRVGPAGTD